MRSDADFRRALLEARGVKSARPRVVYSDFPSISGSGSLYSDGWEVRWHARGSLFHVVASNNTKRREFGNLSEESLGLLITFWEKSRCAIFHFTKIEGDYMIRLDDLRLVAFNGRMCSVPLHSGDIFRGHWLAVTERLRVEKANRK